MKKIGIIGGIGPESTIEYYRLIIKKFQEKLDTNNYPELLIQNVNMTEMIGYAFNNRIAELVHFLQKRINILEQSGVDYVALASNTPHIAFDELSQKVKPTLISIVEETCKSITNQGIKKLALFGTNSTMTHGFYQKVAAKYGLEIIIPTEKDREYIHGKYIGELIPRNIIRDTKEGLIKIAYNLKETDGIEGLILGGTELSLILNPSDFEGIKIFDTTEIHVESIVNAMIKD